MNKKLTQSLAIALVLLSSTSFAATKDVIINANVVGTCGFVDASPVTIEFGKLQAGDTAPATEKGTAGFWCSKDTSYTLSANNGKNAGSGDQKYLKSAENEIPYALALDNTAGKGQGKTIPIITTLTATIAGTALDAVPAGAYTDTVTLTLLP